MSIYQKTSLDDVINVIEQYIKDEFPNWKKVTPSEYVNIVSKIDKAITSSFLRRMSWNMVKTAVCIGVNRNTLRMKMIKYGLYTEKYKDLERELRYPKIAITSYIQSHMEEKRV